MSNKPKERHIWVVYTADLSERLGQFTYSTQDPAEALQVAKNMGVYKQEVAVVYGGISNRKCCGQS